MTLDNIQIKKKYFVTTDSGEVIRVTTHGISAAGNVKCTVDDLGIALSGRFKMNPLALKPNELCEKADFASMNILLDKAEKQIAKLKNERAVIEARVRRLTEKECKMINNDFKSDMKLFATTMVIPEFTDKWKEKLFEVVKNQGVPVSKEYLIYVVFNPDRFKEYDEINPMPYDLFGIEGFLNDIYDDCADIYDKLCEFVKSEFYRLNPELKYKPYDLCDLMEEEYLNTSFYFIIEEELFAKIPAKEFMEFVLSIVE